MTIHVRPRDDAGQGMTEYGLILVLVAMVIVAVMTTTGQSITGMLTYVLGQIAS